MLSSEMTAAIKSQQRVATILWLAVTAWVLIYGLVLFLMQHQGTLSEIAANNPGVYALLVDIRTSLPVS
jgi:hypothetical protein